LWIEKGKTKTVDNTPERMYNGIDREKEHNRLLYRCRLSPSGISFKETKNGQSDQFLERCVLGVFVLCGFLAICILGLSTGNLSKNTH
jgi:hypothetical protein